MRIFVYPHRLHSVEAVDDGQSVKAQISILQEEKERKKNVNANKRVLKAHTLTLLSNSILNASGPRCDILSKFSQMQVKDCDSSPNNAQIPHILPGVERRLAFDATCARISPGCVSQEIY